MRATGNLVFKAWMLPLIILALVLPGSAAFIVGGPGVGLAVGALTATAVVLVAALKRPDEPIEVARADDDRRRVLVVVTEPLDEPDAVESVRQAMGADPSADPEVLVLAPALDTPLDRWASDVRRSRLDAQRRLVLTLGALAAARVEAQGTVGDPDPLQAVEDTLRDFAADEVIVAVPGHPEEGELSLLDELRRRLDLPVYGLRSGPPVGAVRS